MSHWKEAHSKPQDFIEGLYPTAGLGRPQDPPRKPGGTILRKGYLGIPAKTASWMCSVQSGFTWMNQVAELGMEQAQKLTDKKLMYEQ